MAGSRVIDPEDFVEQEETSSLDLAGKELMSTDWTDEKHNLYLKSMEASFVDQLYSSMDKLGWQPWIDHHLDGRSPICAKSRTSGQFKVHRNGYWQKINFEGAGSQSEKVDEHRILLSNPWIQRFRAGDRQDGSHGTQTENVLFARKFVDSRGKKSLTRGSGDISELCAAPCAQAGPSNISEEFSDQNFVDEDEGDDGVANPHAAKKPKTDDVVASHNDQVVPFGKYLLSEGCSLHARRADNDWIMVESNDSI